MLRDALVASSRHVRHRDSKLITYSQIDVIRAYRHGADQFDGGHGEEGLPGDGNGGAYHHIRLMLSETWDDGAFVQGQWVLVVRVFQRGGECG